MSTPPRGEGRTARGMETRDAVLQIARRLFGERGFAAVTIREVASQAGVSPALVMKIAGSKEQLHALATPSEPAPLLPDTPLDGMGELLVRRMLQRRDDDSAEPWLRAMYLLHDAPDPDAARAEFRERFLGRFPQQGDGGRVADEIACLLLGLAAGVRTFRLLDPGAVDVERVVEEYGSLLQGLIDRLPPK